MGSTIKKLPNEPIVINTVSGDAIDLLNDVEFGRELVEIFDASDEPVFLILDNTALQAKLDDVVLAASKVARSASPLFKHPKIRQILTVTNNPVFELAAEGMSSELFGNVSIRVFNSLEDALAYARATR